MSVTTGATKVRPTSDHAQAHASPRRLTELPSLMDGDGAVTVLRRRPVVPHGTLGKGDLLDGRRLVTARDLHDAPWWLPAITVWSDAEDADRPEHPWHIGLATDRSWSRAVLTGLSHRLGWEAEQAYERGEWMHELRGVGPAGPSTVYDGRVGHEVPTVVVTSDRATRSGAGITAESAYRRALFGDQGIADEDASRELADVELVLADAGLHVAVVDLGTAMLRRAGVARVSVQLMGR